MSLSFYWLKSLTWCLVFVVIGQCQLAAQERRDDSLFDQFALQAKQSDDPTATYYVVFWRDYIPDSIIITRSLSDHVAIIKANSNCFLSLRNAGIQIAPANNLWKLPNSLNAVTKSGNQLQKYVLVGEDINALIEVLQLKKKEISILSVNLPTISVIIRCRPSYINTILDLKEVIFINTLAAPHPEANIIGYDRSFHGINAVDFLIPGANGKNIVVGVKEQQMDDNDIDLWKRILPSPIASPDVSDHATVIASIIGGAGNSSFYGRGIAWKCKFFPSTYANLFADDATVLNANKVSVQNHSYGTVIEQFYGPEAVSYDQLTWNNKNLIAVMSAGNQGLSAATEGQYMNIAGYANITGNFKMAKNVITVGAIDKKDILPPLSSSGPLYDGRLAPQLVALGPNGTSDAAAIVSGTIAVMQQVYADSNNNVLPPASLVKAVLFNTADDIFIAGPDYKTGFGQLNSYAAVRAIQQKKYDGGTIGNGQQWTKSIDISPGIASVKVTLAWTDSFATVNNNRSIINDLDLQVIELSSSTIYRPLALSTVPNKDSLLKPAYQKRDSLNTAEQVSIRLPNSGTYQVKVNGTSIKSVSIPFHISYRTDTLNTFYFNSPLHASDVNRHENENLNIRWTTYVADTTLSGNLFISYNSGTSWEMIGPSVKLAPGKFQWKIKDTSAIAMLKMETPFGNFSSDKFVIAPWTSIKVDFNCSDSFRISWNKHIDATAYRIYTLTDSPYLKNIITVSDTFAVFQNVSSPSRVYAVEPVLSSGIPAVRSQALNIDLQGVHCFYKTLNYNLYDSNKLELVLELSAENYIDSIFFERVASGGVLLNTYGGQKGTGNLVYKQFINNVTEGTIYLRARIKLKNGSIVYTDIVPVTTSGNRYISFYPNPVQKNGSLKVVLQQGISTDSKLCLYDIYGRLLYSFPYIPDRIDISRLHGGIIIYRLLDEENRKLQSGKILIQ